MSTPDPRVTLKDKWPEVKVFIRWMPDYFGRTIWADDGPLIEIAADLGIEQQTMTLAHELAHLELGKPCRSFCRDNEQEAVAWTARYLIPDIAPLGRLLARQDVATAAAKLGLPAAAVTDRLAFMTPAEIDTIAPLLQGSIDTEVPARAAASPRRSAPEPHPCRLRRSHT